MVETFPFLQVELPRSHGQISPGFVGTPIRTIHKNQNKTPLRRTICFSNLSFLPTMKYKDIAWAFAASVVLTTGVAVFATRKNRNQESDEVSGRCDTTLSFINHPSSLGLHLVEATFSAEWHGSRFHR